MSEHHTRILETCINPRPPEDEPLGHAFIEVLTDLDPSAMPFARNLLRKCFLWHQLWVIQAVCYRNKNPAFRPMLDKWQAILDAIQANPEILQRCIDKARAKPDSLP